MPQRPRSGRPPMTFAEEDAAMVEVVSRHPFMPPKDVAAAAGVDNIHVSLLSTRLKKVGLQTLKPCGKVTLSQEAAELTLLNHLQYLVQPPAASITHCKRRAIDSARVSNSAGRRQSSPHLCRTCVHSWSAVRCRPHWLSSVSSCAIRAHTLSMVFKSGLLSGQSRILVYSQCSASQAVVSHAVCWGTLSCCRTHGSPRAA